MSQVPPLPLIDSLTAPYWEGCRQGRLLLQRCSNCGGYRFPPQRRCPRCHTATLEWVPARGTGRIYSYTIVHPPVLPPFADRVPLPVVLVELDEGVHLVSNLVDCPDGALRIGLPVAVRFQPVADDVTLPVFAPAGADGQGQED